MSSWRHSHQEPGTTILHFVMLCGYEYSLYIDPASATISGLATMQEKHDSTKDYYRHLRAAYFQVYNVPGLEEEPTFKLLFLLLHKTIRYSVIVQCRLNQNMHR